MCCGIYKEAQISIRDIEMRLIQGKRGLGNLESICIRLIVIFSKGEILNLEMLFSR